MTPQSPPPPSQPMDILRLLWRVDHAVGSLSRSMLTHLGVTGPQRLVLRTLLLAPDTTPSGLAEVLHLDRSAVSGILHRLQEAHLLEREPDPTDRRRQRLRLTPAGRRVDALRHGTVEAAMARALEGVDAEEIACVTRFLATLAGELDREREELVGTEGPRR